MRHTSIAAGLSDLSSRLLNKLLQHLKQVLLYLRVLRDNLVAIVFHALHPVWRRWHMVVDNLLRESQGNLARQVADVHHLHCGICGAS